MNNQHDIRREIDRNLKPFIDMLDDKRQNQDRQAWLDSIRGLRNSILENPEQFLSIKPIDRALLEENVHLILFEQLQVTADDIGAFAFDRS